MKNTNKSMTKGQLQHKLEVIGTLINDGNYSSAKAQLTRLKNTSESKLVRSCCIRVYAKLNVEHAKGALESLRMMYKMVDSIRTNGNICVYHFNHKWHKWA